MLCVTVYDHKETFLLLTTLAQLVRLSEMLALWTHVIRRVCSYQVLQQFSSWYSQPKCQFFCCSSLFVHCSLRWSGALALLLLKRMSLLQIFIRKAYSLSRVLLSKLFTVDIIWHLNWDVKACFYWSCRTFLLTEQFTDNICEDFMQWREVHAFFKSGFGNLFRTADRLSMK